MLYKFTKVHISADLTLCSLGHCPAEIREQSAEEDAEVDADGGKQPDAGPERPACEEPAGSLVSVGVEAKIR